MIPYLLVWILPLLTPNQQSQTDSLKMLVEKSENDSIRAVNLYSLSRHYYTFEVDSALIYAREAQEISKANGFSQLESNSLNIIGVIYLMKSEFEKSLSTHFKALDIREANQDSIGIVGSKLNIGNVYYRLKEPEKAVQEYHESLKIAEIINHEIFLSLLYNNLGSFYRDRWLAFTDERDYKLALDFLSKSKSMKEKLNDKRGLINTLNQLGEVHYESGNKKEGILLLKKSLALSEELNDTEGRLAALAQLSDFFRDDNSLTTALEYASQSYDIAKETNSYYHIANAASKMAHLSSLTQDYQNAYQFQLIKEANNDSIFNESRQKIRDELEIQYESEKKELENHKLIKDSELAELSIQRKTELLWIFIAAGIVLLILAWRQRMINQKLRAAHRELEKVNATIQSQNQQIQQQSSELNITNLALTQANKFRDKLFSIISHDLRTPFASLNNSLELWQAGELSQEEMDFIVSSIARDARSASILLSNLLTWARTQMSSEKVEKTEIRLAQLIDDNQNLFSKQLDHKNQRLENLVPATLMINTDKDRLNFIIRNILSNSIKFTPDGGTIVLEVAPTQPKTILITDNGIGMSPTQIDSLFHKKLYSTAGTNGEQGTGIGLMLCKDFAESIGAKISVSSVAGKSTTFRVEL